MGAHVIALLCETRGASNAKARRVLGWSPARASWREGFAELAAPATARCYALGGSVSGTSNCPRTPASNVTIPRTRPPSMRRTSIASAR